MEDPFELYKERWQQWHECLTSKDQHSLWQQIWHANWNMAAYRTVLKAMELAPAAEGGGRELNGMVFNLFQETFFDAMSIRVRRLVEVERDGLDRGERAVFSLGTLLKDMEDHAHLMTIEHINRMNRERGSDEWWVRMCERHVERLLSYSGISCDHVPKEFFIDLRHRLERETEKVAGFVNKYVAHAATPLSRQTHVLSGPSFTDLMRSLQLLFETAELVGVYLVDGGSHAQLPVPQYDQFVYLERSLAPNDSTMEALYDQWRRTEDEMHGWQMDFDTTLAELKACQQA